MNTSSAYAFDKVSPHRIVPGFLGEELVNRLLDYVISHQEDFRDAQVGYEIEEVNPAIRVAKVLYDFGELREEVLKRFVEIMPEAVASLHLSDFELDKCELELAAHGDGAFFKRHADTFVGVRENKRQRVLTGVLYFHALPKGFSHGALRLYSLNPSVSTHVDIIPERDQLVLFPAWAEHEVLPVSCPSKEFRDFRFAINCWFNRPVRSDTKTNGV